MKCCQQVKSFCELFHGTNMLTLGVGGEKNQIAADAVCLKKKRLTLNIVALFCKYFRQVHCCPEIHIYTCF